jgi:hypothetical protein
MNEFMDAIGRVRQMNRTLYVNLNRGLAVPRRIEEDTLYTIETVEGIKGKRPACIYTFYRGHAGIPKESKLWYVAVRGPSDTRYAVVPGAWAKTQNISKMTLWRLMIQEDGRWRFEFDVKM